MARLIDEFLGSLDARSERGVGGSVGRIMERFGWSTKDVARELGVSERTARRWRQQDRVPDKRRQDWRDVVKGENRKRAEGNIGRRGIRTMTVQGTYKVSERKYKTGPGSAVRILPGDKISPAQMREVFGHVNAGDLDAADAALNEALAEAYDAPGLSMEDVESLEWGI